MNRRLLIILLATLTSHIVKKNILQYSCLGPPYEAWVGSSAFSTATAVVLASFVRLPYGRDTAPTTIIYTYYTITSLLISILAVKLLWVPVVNFVCEVNMILSKTVLYLHRLLYPNSKTSFFKQVGKFLGTKTAIIWSTNLLGLLFLYAASTDILKYMEVYLYSLPKRGFFAKMRSIALRAIGTLLYVVSSQTHVRFHCEPEVKYFSDSESKHNFKQQYCED